MRMLLFAEYKKKNGINNDDAIINKDDNDVIIGRGSAGRALLETGRQ